MKFIYHYLHQCVAYFVVMGLLSMLSLPSALLTQCATTANKIK